jgi:hypothetical protein
LCPSQLQHRQATASISSFSADTPPKQPTLLTAQSQVRVLTVTCTMGVPFPFQLTWKGFFPSQLQST